MRIALAVTEFPSASQTFVLDHACGLIERGHVLDLHALQPGKLQQPHAGIAAFDLLKRVHYAPPALPSASRTVRLLSFLWHGGMTLWKNSRITWRFLAMPKGNRFDVMRRCLSFWAPAADYDLIHAHSGYNAHRLIPLYESGHLRAPLVITFHGHDVHAFLRTRPENYYRTTFAHAAALIVCSNFMRTRLLALGATAENLHVIPNGVDIDGIDFRERQLPLDRPLRLLTIGRLVPFKGISVLIQALQQTIMQRVNWQLDIIGDGPLRNTLIEQVNMAGLSKRVFFHGACGREKVLSTINASDLYLAPAIIDNDGNTETQGVALLEAMASGLPVIASDVGGIPETMGGTAAHLVPSGDVAALAAAIQKLQQQPERWAMLSQSGRARVAQHYDRRAWIDRLESVYRSVESAHQLAADANNTST